MSDKPAKYMDTGAVAQGALPPVTLEDAEAVRADAELPATVNFRKARARKIIGEFLGHDVHGHIMTESMITMEQMSVMENILMAKIKNKQTSAKMILAYMRQMTEIHKTRIMMAENVQFKVGEVCAKRGKIGQERGAAPDLGGSPHNLAPHIHADSVYVNIVDSPQKVEPPKS